MSKKKCFCINANGVIDDDEIIPNSTDVNDEDNQFMLTPFISDQIDKNDQVLCILSDLMSVAIDKAEKYDDVIPSNVEIPIVNDTFDKMAKTSGINYKEPNDMNIFTDNKGIQEDFACDTVCSKNINKSMFEHEETKYLLFIIAVLFLCVIMFRK